MRVAGGQGLPRCRVTGLWHQKHYHLTCRDNEYTHCSFTVSWPVHSVHTRAQSMEPITLYIHIVYVFLSQQTAVIWKLLQLPQKSECIPFSITMNESLIQTFKTRLQGNKLCSVCLMSCSIEALHPLSANTFDCPCFYVSLITCSVEWSKFYNTWLYNDDSISWGLGILKWNMF